MAKKESIDIVCNIWHYRHRMHWFSIALNKFNLCEWFCKFVAQNRNWHRKTETGPFILGLFRIMKIFWSEMRRLRHAVLYLYYVLQMYCCWRACDDDHVTQIITNKKKLKPKTKTTLAVLCQPCHHVVKHGFFHCIYTISCVRTCTCICDEEKLCLDLKFPRRRIPLT